MDNGQLRNPFGMIIKRQNMSENNWNHFKIVSHALSIVNCQFGEAAKFQFNVRVSIIISDSGFRVKKKGAGNALPGHFLSPGSGFRGSLPPDCGVTFSGRTCSRCTDPRWGSSRECPPGSAPESSSFRCRSGWRTGKRCTRYTYLRDSSYIVPPFH